MSNDLTGQLVEQVKTAIDSRCGITILGRGTKKHLGRDPHSRSAIDSTHSAHSNERVEVICVADHSGIISYEPIELVMRARAGTSLSEIDEALAQHGQSLACDPARFNGNASIAGSLATNQAGPGRPWHGSLRDHVLGVHLINGNAELLRFGGQVMKNVAGYDVSRLQAGAMGTLGIITEISFKVMPKPTAEITLTQSASIDEAIALMTAFAHNPKPLSGACWVDGRVYLRLSGAQSAVDGSVRQWLGDVMPNTEAMHFWHHLRERQLPFFSTRALQQPLWRFSLNSATPAFFPEGDWLIDWAGGLRWLKSDMDADNIYEWAKAHQADVCLYHGGDRQGDIVALPGQTVKRLQTNLKRAFDPHHLFNIGRLYSWL